MKKETKKTTKKVATKVEIKDEVKEVKSSELVLSTGAVLNPVDYRDLSVTADVTPLPDVSKIKSFKYEKIDLVPVLNQESHGACVGHAEAVVKAILDFEETGNLEVLSPAYLYGVCKSIDGSPDREGTFPRIAGKVLVERGVPSVMLYPNNTSLSREEYNKVNTTPEIEKDASKHKVKSYGFTPADLEMFLATIYSKKAVGITLVCNEPNKWYETEVIPAPVGSMISLHRVFAYGWNRTEDGVEILCRNSWGENAHKEGKGNFRFKWLDYKNSIYDIMPYIDASNKALEDIKKQDNTFSYEWTQNLSVNTNGSWYKNDILALQKALKITGDFYSKVKGDLEPTGFFSTLTEQSVKRYQARKGIKQTGVFAILTRTALNADFAKKKA